VGIQQVTADIVGGANITDRLSSRIDKNNPVVSVGKDDPLSHAGQDCTKDGRILHSEEIQSSLLPALPGRNIIDSPPSRAAIARLLIILIQLFISPQFSAEVTVFMQKVADRLHAAPAGKRY
jgi:hypothetical protein